MLLPRLEYLPAPFAVDGILRDTIHQEETFDGLRSLQIVRIEPSDLVVFFPVV